MPGPRPFLILPGMFLVLDQELCFCRYIRASGKTLDQPSPHCRRMGGPILPNVPPSLRRLTDLGLLNSRLSEDYKNMATHPHTYTKCILTKSTAPPLNSPTSYGYPGIKNKKPPISLRLIKWDPTLPPGLGPTWIAPACLFADGNNISSNESLTQEDNVFYCALWTLNP